MAWIVVPPLQALLEQLNAIAPNRDKTTDGSIGDTSHAAGRSSHNPDRTGNPEHRDGDSLDEIRARDFDKDLRTPGLTMAMVVRHLVQGARSGRFWWIRYIIFDKIIYHKNTGFQARAYTGQNTHTEHAHVNSDFTQAADSARNVDYGLDELIDMPLSESEMNRIADLTVEKLLNTRVADAADNDGDRRSLSIRTWFEYFDGRERTTQQVVIDELGRRVEGLRANLHATERALANMVVQVGAKLDGPISTQLNVIEDAVQSADAPPVVTTEQVQQGILGALVELGKPRTPQ